MADLQQRGGHGVVQSGFQSSSVRLTQSQRQRQVHGQVHVHGNIVQQRQQGGKIECLIQHLSVMKL